MYCLLSHDFRHDGTLELEDALTPVKKRDTNVKAKINCWQDPVKMTPRDPVKMTPRDPVKMTPRDPVKMTPRDTD